MVGKEVERKGMVRLMINYFFMYSYFGIVTTDSMEKIIQKAASKAYLDLCRTIHFYTDITDVQKLARKNEMCWYLVQAYSTLYNVVISRFLDVEKQTQFDCEHKKICDKMCNAYTTISEFTYGQAQKWLNMTLKYILLIQELIEGTDLELYFSDNNFKKFTHVPVDSYIMQAVSSSNAKFEHSLNLHCVPKRSGNVGKYSENASKPWSKWNYNEYISFQKCIREAISKNNCYSSPINWENKAWIEIASYKKIKQTLKEII